ncbi:hypothetical protein [Halorubellus salinus]|uniref:hypothetical protein n=1 Tax=Halorubellus salinus TaxID=755309 RepID=UPI001D078906|nr:hypothetical protein [Halorubellus salinus]
MKWRWLLDADVRWRTLVAAYLGVLLVTGSVVGYVRIADVHGPPAEHRISPDAEPGQMIATANEAFQHVDHRTVTRVHVQNESERRPLFAYEYLYDYSDRQFFGQRVWTGSYAKRWERSYTPYWFPLAVLPGKYYVTDGRAEIGANYPEGSSLGSREFEDPSPPFRGGAFSASSPDNVWEFAYGGNVFLQGASDADWRVVSENASTLVLGIDDHEEYYETRQMFYARDVHEGSSIRVFVDKESGRVTRMVEHRVATYEVTVETADGEYEDVERTRHYVVVTEFSEYGTVDLERPEGVGPPTLKELWRDFFYY